MAEDRLTPAALAGVRDLLGPGVGLAEISTWADEQREVPGAASWHYVNMPITESRYDPQYCPAKGYIVGKIEDFKRCFGIEGRKTEKQYLKFVTC
jgi:hypothetical protein